MQDIDSSFNEVRYAQYIRFLKNTRAEYRHAIDQQPIHKVIYEVSQKYNPLDWHQLILELPHLASDGESIGYYRKSADLSNKVTIIKPGRYLTRHFPQLPDHIIRDYVSPYIAKVKILDDLESMLHSVTNGPYTCMVNFDFNVHPYECYKPEFGWKMAVRTLDDNIIGRALINGNRFITCYAKSSKKSGENYALAADNILESWLEYNGYIKTDNWEHLKLAKIEYLGKIVAPYLDGICDDLIDRGDHMVIVNKDSDCDYSATSKLGFAIEKPRTRSVPWSRMSWTN